MSYEPTLAIWAVGRHQRLAGRAITHETIALAERNYDYLCEFPATPRLLESKIVYRDESRIVCDGDQSTCHMQDAKWADLPIVYAQGYGDCKCLVAIRLAECWRDGREAYPLPRCYKCRTTKSRFCRTCQRPLGNGQTWHMQLVHDDGRIEDISRWLGMPAHPDGDDAIVDTFDQVGMVRLHPRGSGASEAGMNVQSVAAAATLAAMLAQNPSAHREKQLPAWVMNRARMTISASTSKPSGICAPTDLSPAGPGAAPRDGIASSLEFPWCVALHRGDGARGIAERITGDRARYLEILAANPVLATVVTDGTMDFAPGALRIGNRLKMPRTFAPWISQTGEPRGQRRAFPPYDTKPEGWRPV